MACVRTRLWRVSEGVCLYSCYNQEPFVAPDTSPSHELLTSPPTDQRGKHRNRGKTIPEMILHEIDTFIKNIPKKTSHYSRRNQTSKKYFSQDIGSTAELHRLYCKEYPSQAMKYNFFREYFITRYNIGFSHPRRDTCGYCNELMLKLEQSSLKDAEKNALIRDKISSICEKPKHFIQN